MASHLPFEIITNEKKIRRLYKGIARYLACWHVDRADYRYAVTLLRAEFDEIKTCKEKDPDGFIKRIKEMEDKLFYYQSVFQEKTWPKSVTGNAYGREQHIPDWVLDYWHPLEKAQYPKYFATREKRKEEFIKMWEEEFGKPDAIKDRHH